MNNRYISRKEKKLKKLKEGNAEFFIFAEDINSTPSKSMNVFYNKKMELNRDLTILAVQTYCELYNKKKLTFVDSMAGSGIGAIRLLKNCSNIQKLYINDINPSATRLIEKNLELNKLLNKEIEINISRKDANLLLNEIAQNKFGSEPLDYKKPDIISIDPFGTPNLYIDSTFKAIKKDHGLLCITATDTPVLFGVRPKACLRKYMAKPLHSEFCKEIGARILLYFVSRIANINNLGIIPLLTFYSSHFIRLFLIIFKSKKEIFKSISNYGYLIYCKDCGHHFEIDLNILNKIKKCTLCEGKTLDYAGPLWIGKLHDINFLKKINSLTKNSGFFIKNKKRIANALNFCLDEINMPIGYYNIHSLCHQIANKSIPTMEVLINQIHKEGYEASRTHFDFTSIKTTMNIISLKNLLKKLENGID
jgi:tRNA (guanine26-N2/guanine27-N2)-dimethyltransferase